MPKLVIISPVYNTEKYLTEFIGSILKQTFTDFVFILIDDGSTDKSNKIIHSYLTKDKRIILIEQKNSGVSSARNAGLEFLKKNNINSKYLYFCDSDDVIAEDSILKVINCLDETNADIGIFSVKYLYKDKIITRKELIRKKCLLNHLDIIKQYFRIGFKWKKLPCSETFLNNKIFRREIIDNERFDVQLKRSEDFDLYLTILPKLKTAVIVPDAWYSYRKRKSSLTNSVANFSDLMVCLKHYDSLISRPFLEQKSVQHKLYRSFYLEIYDYIVSKDFSNAKNLVYKFRSFDFKYGKKLSDIKIIFLLNLPFKMIVLYMLNRRKNKADRTTIADYFD